MGGDRGGAGCRVWEAYLHPVCEVTHTVAGAQLHSLFGSFTPLMSAPNRGGKEKKRREGGKKPSGEGRKQEEGIKKWGREEAGGGDQEGEREGGFPWRARPSHLSLSPALTGTYCGAAVMGALTSVNMSYCLPTWPRGCPVSTHPLDSPNQCHWVTVFCAGSCNGGPDREELCISSLGLSHRQQAASAPRHNSPGSAPKKCSLKYTVA